MNKQFEENLNKEITKRVAYYDSEESNIKSDFTKLHYFLAIFVAVIGVFYTSTWNQKSIKKSAIRIW
ncbi:MAG: hypothetical protein PUE01_12045 [Clostridiaceae bacterium]|nr:hypothetical protein [Clostridiaceae bacterium]